MIKNQLKRYYSNKVQILKFMIKFWKIRLNQQMIISVKIKKILLICLTGRNNFRKTMKNNSK